MTGIEKLKIDKIESLLSQVNEMPHNVIISSFYNVCCPHDNYSEEYKHKYNEYEAKLAEALSISVDALRTRADMLNELWKE